MSPLCPTQSATHNEMSKLFSWNAAASLCSSKSKGKGKRPLSATSHSHSSKKKKLKTWTHTFFCLSKVDHYHIPDSSERVALKLAGLGEKRFSVFAYGSSQEVQDELVREYPKLIDAGGFELLRASELGSKQLEPIEMPSNGYSVEYIRAVVKSAKIYIRPLQRDLDITPIEDEV